MRKLLSIILILIMLIASAFGSKMEVFALTAEESRIEDLRKQIAELENQAKLYRDSVATERAKGNSLQREITVLKNQMSAIETEISLTNKKIDRSKLEIQGLEGDIFDTQNNISKQKETIGRLLVFLNRQDDEPLITTLVKNQSISEFFRQGQYLANVNTQLLALVDDLDRAKKDLEGDKTNLEDKQMELERLKQESQAKKSSLSVTKSSKDTLLSQTKGQEAQYQKMLTEIEKREAEFFKELRALETKIVAGGLFIVHVTASSVAPRGTKLFQYPEEGTRLTQGYGMTSYAKKGAYGGSPHNGIDMAGGYGTSVKAIGDGEIIANGYNDGFGNWVAIKHLNSMVSVYAHMSGLSPLKVGTAVKVGDVIGYEGSTGNSTGSHLHLSLYRDFFTYINEKKGQLYFNYFDGSLNPLDYL